MILQGIRGECTSHCVNLAFRVAVFILSAQHVTDVTAAAAAVVRAGSVGRCCSSTLGVSAGLLACHWYADVR